MPEQILALEPGGEPRIKLEWGGYMREFKIEFDGELVGEIDGGQSELKEGREFELPDGSLLTIRLNQSMFFDELEVKRDGVPLPGSAADPRNKFSFTISLVFFWGVISVIAGALQLVDSGTLLLSLGFSQYSILFGLAMMGCAYLIYKQILLAVFLALILFFADWFVAVTIALDADIEPNSLGILVHVVVAILFFQGWRALRELRRSKHS
jgi:hypothetical protein